MGLTRFADVVGREDIPLDHAALLIGAWEEPKRDVDAYFMMLDRIAREASPDVARATSGIGRARAISERTDRRTTWQDVREVVRDLNWTLRGWSGYFSVGTVVPARKPRTSEPGGRTTTPPLAVGAVCGVLWVALTNPLHEPSPWP